MKVLFFCLLLVLNHVSCFSNRNTDKPLDAHIKDKAITLKNAGDLDKLINQAADKKLVLLGEASHGTHEYYAWRDSISRRLIAEKGFNFILVEGDFASLFELNRYVKDLPGAAASAEEVLKQLDRWPLWMWGNHEVVALAEWLRAYNKTRPNDKKVGFYGMDVYDEWRSMEVLLAFLRKNNPNLYELAKKHYACFAPYNKDSWLYARYAQAGHVNCAKSTEDVLALLLNNRDRFNDISDYDYFYALQNAYVFKYAEKFYRKSAMGLNSASWNARVIHMHKTSKRLLQLYGQNAKGIVWAHNTHIGDASYTDMARVNQVNIGQLSRDHFGKDNVLLVGFTTYKGRVLAGSQWGSARENMQIPRAEKNSIEEILQRTGLKSFYLLFDDTDRSHPEFMRPMGNRAIGVVYNPRFDARQFVSTIVPMRYDALIFFEETKGLYPLID